MFKPKEFLNDAIETRNLIRVYTEFSVILHEDPSFSTGKFDDTLNYVKSLNLPDFMKVFDGREFEAKDSWNDDYWAVMVSSLIDNFCEERIDHLRDVGKYLYGKKLPPMVESLRPDQMPKMSTDHAGRTVSQEEININWPVGAAVGLGVTSIVSLVVGAKTTAILTGIAAIGLGVYYILDDHR